MPNIVTHVLPHLVGKFLHRVLRHQRVVRRDAGLAGIEQLGIGDALRGLVEIGGAVDDRGRFAAEFQRHRGQVAPGGFGDDAGRPGSSR